MRGRPNPPAPFPKREGGELSRKTLGFSPPSRFGKGAGGVGFFTGDRPHVRPIPQSAKLADPLAPRAPAARRPGRKAEDDAGRVSDVAQRTRHRLQSKIQPRSDDV